MKSRVLAQLFALLLLSSPWSRSDATSVIPSTTPEDLAGAWLGETDAGQYLRLEVNSSGKGLLAVQWGFREEVSLYKITATHLKDWDISFCLTPISGAEVITLKGKANEIELLLVLNGTEGDWDYKTTLSRESYVLDRIEAVTRASKKFHSASGQ